MSLIDTHPEEVRQFRDLALSYIDHTALTGPPSSPDQFLLYRFIKADWVQSSLPVLPAAAAAEGLGQAGRHIEVKARYTHTQGQNANLALAFTNQDRTPGDYILTAKVDPFTGELSDEDPCLYLAGSANSGGLFEFPQASARAVIDATFAHHANFASQARQLPLADAFRLGVALQATLPGVKTDTHETISKHIGDSQAATLTFKVQVTNRTHDNGQPSRLWLGLNRKFPAGAGHPSGYLLQELTLITATNGGLTGATRQSKLYYNNVVIRDYGNGPRPMMLPEKATQIPPRFTSLVYSDDQPTLEDLAFFQYLVAGPIGQKDLLV